jgi:5-methylcytosine-specific restriction protein A
MAAANIIMTTQELDEVFANLDYREDARAPADEGRRRAFIHGWKDGADREKDYDKSSLRQLTWQNFGFRLGKEFGVLREDQIFEVFTHFDDTFQKEQGRREWSDDELKAAAAAYLEMLALEQAEKSYSKAEFRRRLIVSEGPLAGRTSGSVEYQMQNISAVLEGMGLPRIKGYLPAKNVGQNTLDRLASILEELGHVDGESYRPTSDPEELDAKTEKLKKNGFAFPPRGREKPKRVASTNQEAFERDPAPAVRAWVILEAKGVCELCGSVAPFRKPDGEPYLEVHHVKPLAKGGPDTTSNAAALCPNCHRRCHLSEDRHEATERLYEEVERLTKEG